MKKGVEAVEKPWEEEKAIENDRRNPPEHGTDDEGAPQHVVEAVDDDDELEAQDEGNGGQGTCEK